MLVEELRDFIERVEIFEHLLSNFGPLDFDRDLPAIAQTRAMHLAQ